ncbi:phage antirepressor KilAC domain-containing protein [Pseudomonas sp. MOB-449]|nr:phage antirepressor KilAC domain-containing protein [Pseudomonas sp. MOB-449]
MAHATMTSREIAELVEKRHDNVKRTIGAIMDSGVILPQIEEVPNEGPGPLTIIQYRLCKRDSFIVVAQLCPEFTARLVDRWQELEALQLAPTSLPNFASPAEAARAWAEQYEQRTAAEQALSIAAPKAAFVDQYVEANGSMGFRQAAKLLKANERQFRQMLLDRGVMYYLGGCLTPHQQHINAGRFDIKTGTSEHSNHAYTQAKFTPKGIQWIAGLWASYCMEAKQ